MTLATRPAEFASIVLLFVPLIAWIGMFLAADAPENLGNK